MASVSTLTGLNYLMQPGEPLSNLPSQVTAAELQSASPADVASLIMASLETQEVDALFGISQTAQSPLPAFPIAPAVAGLTNPAPQQQEIQNLFGETPNPGNTLNLFG